jgi:exopolysaccharide biosynthesis polyprenyl glycosylphosphotransferase
MVNLSESRNFSPDESRSATSPPGPRVSFVPQRRKHGLSTNAYTVGLIAVDYVAAWISLLLGLLLLSSFSRNPVNHLSHFAVNLQHGFWYPIGIVAGFTITGGYRLSRRSPTQSTFSELKEYAMSCCFGAFIALTMSYVAHHFGSWSIQVPTQVILAVVISSFLIALSHSTLRHLVLRRRPQRVAVVDDGTNYGRIATHLHLQHGVVLVGRIDSGDVATPDSIGTIDRIDSIASIHKLDRVIFGTMTISTSAVEHGYRRATEIVDTALVPRMYEVISWRSRLTELSGLPLLELAPRHFSHYDRAIKRAFDLFFSFVALLVTLPIWISVAVAVKLTSRGPVLFQQERLGRNRKPFTIFKFRTMRHDDADNPVSGSVSESVLSGDRSPLYLARGKEAHVNRLTPIGAFLRRSGLDEIPQFFNVVRGSMSIVGPRPFVTEESEARSQWSERRFEVDPGITGLWQVSGRNNLTEDELHQLDYLYVSSWSMWWDMKICFDTPRAMFRGLGAY